jgi:hypothetical protein
MAIRKLPPWALTLISVAPAFALLPFVKILPDIALLTWCALALVWVVVLACLSWRRLDETGRAAHRSAWFFGGSAALFLSLLGASILFLVPGGSTPLVEFIDTWSKKHPAGEMGFMFGLLFAAIVQTIGYFIAWAFWWAKRR